VVAPSLSHRDLLSTRVVAVPCEGSFTETHPHWRRRKPVARRTNYGFEKRQRELRKKKKKEEKAELKRLKTEAAMSEGEEGVEENDEDSQPPDPLG
jgi:hypothetical protein